QLAERAEAVGDLPPVEVDDRLALLPVDPAHDAEVAVEHLALVVVGYLHHLIAGAEGPTERSARPAPRPAGSATAAARRWASAPRARRAASGTASGRPGPGRGRSGGGCARAPRSTAWP